MPDVALPNNWRPRDYQLPLWGYLEHGGKRAVAVWHRRAGKDEVALHRTACAAFERPGNYWHMLPHANQSRKAIWEAVNPHTGIRRIDEVFPEELRAGTRNTDMRIELINGSSWQVVGSDNFDSLVGSPPVGIVFSEWALADPRAWAVLRPILRENGGWALFIYTPRGRNHGERTYRLAREEDGWFGQVLKAQDTGVFPPEDLEAERREMISDFGEEEGAGLFEREYECSFDTPVPGSYYGSLIRRAYADGRIEPLPLLANVPVDTAWDIGVGDSTAIWFFQVKYPWVHFLDYYEAQGYSAEHYAGKLREFATDRGYVYGKHFMPHDIKVREWGGGHTRVESLVKLGVTPHLVDWGYIDDGINAVRQLLPRCRFDLKRCAEAEYLGHSGLDCLTEYHRQFDDKAAIFLDRPVERHWSKHGADAFRTFAMGYREQRPDEIKKPITALPTLNEVLERHDRKVAGRRQRI